MKILSIIIPTYNMEVLLPQCLDSLVVINNLDYIDIIVVNDGSKDMSSEIAHFYADKYPNSLRVIDKDNGNYGSCINAALPLVNGKYVKILDADDSFNTTHLDKYIDTLQTIDADLVLTDFANYDSDGNQLSKTTFSFPVSRAFPFSDIPVGKFLAMHSVTYRSEIFKQIDYHQSEGVSYTDMEWIYYPMSQVYNVFYYNREIYRYLVGREGQTMDFSIILKRQSHAEKGILAELAILERLPENTNNYEYLKYWLLFRVENLYKENILLDCIDYDLHQFDERIKHNSPWLYNRVTGITVISKHLGLKVPIVEIWRTYSSKKMMLCNPRFLLYKILQKF